jgi:hypothetical protein
MTLTPAALTSSEPAGQTPSYNPAETLAEDPRIAALEQKLSAQQAAHRTSLAHAELKLHAVRAGMIDLDGLKLVDPSRIKLSDAGEVEGADRLMADLRRDKPWLFRHATTSTPGSPPPSTPPAAKSAMQMNETEWRAARAALLKRR